jgi:hypothetical protein
MNSSLSLSLSTKEAPNNKKPQKEFFLKTLNEHKLESLPSTKDNATQIITNPKKKKKTPNEHKSKVLPSTKTMQPNPTQTNPIKTKQKQK